MASHTLSRFLPLFALLLPCLSASDFACKWAPQLSNSSEALQVECTTPSGLDVRIHVTVDGWAKGHPLRTASGWPDKHALLPAPIEDLDTYRVTKIVIRIAGKPYVVEQPAQHFMLDTDGSL